MQKSKDLMRIRELLNEWAEEQEPEDIFERLDGRSVTVCAAARGDGELFGWVGPALIAEAVKRELEVDVQPDQVILSKSFRELGVYDVSIRLGGTWPTPKIKVWIVKEAYNEPNETDETDEPEQPEEPKVESLREAARRLGARHMDAQAVHADIAAIVLRQHLALLKLFVAHVTEPVSSETDVRRWARWECDQVDQMLEGSE